MASAIVGASRPEQLEDTCAAAGRRLDDEVLAAVDKAVAGALEPQMLAFIPAPPTNGFQLGPFFFHLYGLCIALGVLAAFWLANRRWVEAGGKPGELERPAIWR